MGAVLHSQARSPLQELLPIVPVFPAQAATPRHAVLPTGALLSSQASSPLQAPVPTAPLLNSQAATPRHEVLPTGALFSTQAKSPLQAPVPTPPLLAQWDDVRTLTGKNRNSSNFNIPSYEEGRKLDWGVPVRDLLLHVRECSAECPQLNMALDNLFGMLSDYQKEAA